VNILFVFYYPSGGVETLARQRSYALKNHGVNFHFLYYKTGPGVQNINETTFISNNDQEIQRIISKGNYKAIIVCSDFRFLQRAKRLGYSGKLIYEVQGLGSFDDAERILKTAQPTILAYADGILYPRTPHLISLVNKYYPNKNKFCFHNCINTEIFHNLQGFKVESNPVIGWVGRLEENKNWRGFLDIAATLLKQNQNINFWMFVDDTLSTLEEENSYHQKVILLKLNSHITRFSNIPHKDMPYYYSRIANSGGLLCSTSKVEGFGYAIVEAMSCMCPVLTTDSDGIKSFIFHNETGKIFPQQNIAIAVSEANELMTNTTLKQTIQTNAQLFVKNNLSPEAYASNFITMLTNLKIK
jgi:L-malate glycosyltransferase